MLPLPLPTTDHIIIRITMITIIITIITTITVTVYVMVIITKVTTVLHVCYFSIKLFAQMRANFDKNV